MRGHSHRQAESVQYLNETVGSLLVGLTAEERSTLNVQILFVDLKPHAHPDWDHKWLNLVDDWSGYDISENPLGFMSEWKAGKKVWAKSIL